MWPHVTNLLDLRYFCQHNPLFYHLNLIPCHYWSWQRNIYFLVNIFVRHTFPMSKSSIKTKTVLTMTDMTESTELQAFKRQKDGYKVTVKISLCICVVLSWDEPKVRQNLLASDYKICMTYLLTFWQEPRFYVVFSPTPFISQASHAIIDINTNEYWCCMKIFVDVESAIYQYVTFVVTNRCFSSSVAVKSGLLLQRYWNLYCSGRRAKRDALGIKTLKGLLHDIEMSFVQEWAHPGCHMTPV